ncbi:predicted protein [Postia placenta Mad-698-R]|nr:predicted protein [Postia placenta Mad-698-R]
MAPSGRLLVQLCMHLVPLLARTRLPHPLTRHPKQRASFLGYAHLFFLVSNQLLCLAVVLVGRIVNILVPWVFAELVHMFEEGAYSSLWIYLFAYVGLRFLQASGGLPALRETGEILRILDRGAAINRAFELILFNVIPTFVDIGLALVLFAIYFEWTLTLVVFFVIAAYVSASIILTRWRTRLRRKMVERDVVTRGIHTDCLLNYETVKYFNGEQHEAERYGEAIREYQTFEYKVIRT